MAKKDKPYDPMAAIIDEMVVFKHEDGRFASNSPYWQDSRVQEAWIAKYGADAPVDDNEDGIADDDEDEEVEVDYAALTNDQLRGELSARKLSVDGNKEALIRRLEADDEAGEE